ncbi:hypothetical protein CYLTODRAFT_457168 [Cylindrobasidium torrendii FP15055 ss-10]|uniref:F-box domain-containing protein n=1 Tax=Cylindrobasidium torrendii FP15055 ss-10 TaxID=1314674 RepID=A0A0D7B2R1_9AGAR|nr:hypothetical protein CYLTODRAFT_457168 [Cylindrobasidium torrendii FP15055 ss-10]
MAMLPVEIKSVIIDCMANFTGDPFVGIALVWPDVLFRIREHRFHTVVLLTAFRARRLLDLLQTSPSIASVVRTLAVENFHVVDTPDVNLPRSLAMMNNITSVKFFNIPCHNGRAMKSFDALPSSVVNVHLHFLCINEMHQEVPLRIDHLFDTLQSFPNVQKLGFNFTRSSTTNFVQSRVQLPHIRVLSLGGDVLSESSFISSFLARAALPSLSSLYIEELHQITPLIPMLHCWGATLKELHVPNHDLLRDTLSTINTAFTLPGGIEAVEFHIRISDDPQEEYYLHAWANALEKHGQSTASHLRRLTISKLEFPWPDAQDIRLYSEALLRFDFVLGTGALAVKHLDWCMCARGGSLEGDSDEPFKWVNGAIFPIVRWRFLSENSEAKFRTTSTISKVFE